MSFIIFGVIWVASGFLGYVLHFNFLQKKFHFLAEKEVWNDRILAACNIPLGLIGLVAVLMVCQPLYKVDRFW